MQNKLESWLKNSNLEILGWLQLVTATLKSEDDCFLVGKLWQT